MDIEVYYYVGIRSNQLSQFLPVTMNKHFTSTGAYREKQELLRLKSSNNNKELRIIKCEITRTIVTE